jgi:hypothetical protein
MSIKVRRKRQRSDLGTMSHRLALASPGQSRVSLLGYFFEQLVGGGASELDASRYRVGLNEPF